MPRALRDDNTVPSLLPSPEGPGPYLVAALSLVVGSLFAAADTAVTSLSSARLGALIEQSKGARRSSLERIRSQAEGLRSRYLIGRIVTAALAAVSFQTGFASHDVGRAPFYAIGATVSLSAVLYELTTTFGRRWADWVAPAAARWLVPLELAMLPLSFPLSLLGRLLGERVQEPATREDQAIAESEVEHMVDQVERSGLVGREPASMIRNVLELQERQARDVMVPREKVEAFDISTGVSEAKRFITESGHSRYPVFSGDIDNIVGLLCAKDLFQIELGKRTPSIAELLRGNPNFVAESMPLSKLLREMRARREHLAVVVGELGNVAGIVTLEDVLEEIVGDIRDEHDEAAIVSLAEDRWLADAALSLSDVESYIGVSLPGIEDPETNDAVSIASLLEGAGDEGLEVRGLRLVVREREDGKVKRVEIERLPPPPAPPSSGHSERPRSWTERPPKAESIKPDSGTEGLRRRAGDTDRGRQSDPDAA